MRIEIDLNKSVESNASDYYERIKHQKKKLEGTKKAIVNTQLKLKKVIEDKNKALESLKPKKETISREWYEKFRWFISSEGFLVLGGRDATSNEILIKKHTEQNDIIFHTDMVGSPFFVVKTENNAPGRPTITEAADATITFSRAFKLGLSTNKVFMAKPEQLTKEAKAGEFVPKGGFVTKGKLEYIDNKINLAVGNYNGKIMAGPIESVKTYCKSYVQLEQGKEKPAKVSKTIHHSINGDIDEIVRVLPAGTFKIKKS
jgi:predicted ribosome quality control (RQC) complex YloA/Tae2 family protein